MLYLMNTTVIPHGADGVWIVTSILPHEAAEFPPNMPWTSAVGHQSSAEAMSAVLGISVPVNRITVVPKPGDKFLCLKLNSRPPEGVVLDREQMEQIGYSWALMAYQG